MRIGLQPCTDGAKERALLIARGLGDDTGIALRARAEMQEALTFLAERFRAIELDGEPRFGTPSGIYGLESLPLKLELSAA